MGSKPMTTTSTSYSVLSIDDLMAHDGFNPRKDLGDIDELVESIRERGVINPPTVCPANDGSGTYWVVAGARRVEACRRLGHSTIACVVRADIAIEKPEALAIAVAENMDGSRQSLAPIDLANAYRRLCEQVGGDSDRTTHAAVAKLVGRTREHVRSTLRILDAPESLREKLARGDLSKQVVKTIMEVPDDIRSRVSERIESLPAKERTENAVRRITNDVAREDAVSQREAATDLESQDAAAPKRNARKLVTVMRSKREVTEQIDAALDRMSSAEKEEDIELHCAMRYVAAALLWVAGVVDSTEPTGREFKAALKEHTEALELRRERESEERAEKDA